MPPDVAAAFFVPQFIEIGERLGRFGARVVGIVDDQAARRDAMIAEDDLPTGHQEVVPRNLAMAKHPGQRRHPVGAKARAFKARPANGVSDEDGGDTKGQPGALNGRHAVARMDLANALVNGFDKPHSQRGRVLQGSWHLQAIDVAQADEKG